MQLKFNKMIAGTLALLLILSSITHSVYATDDVNNEISEGLMRVPQEEVENGTIPNDNVEPQAEVEPEDDVEPPADDSTTINLADDNISSNVPNLGDLTSDESQLVIPQGEDEHDFTTYALNTVTINENQTKEEVETAIQAALDSATPGQTVTLKGKSNVPSQIQMYIPLDITLLSEAEMRTSSDRVLTLTGSGTFVLDSSGLIHGAQTGLHIPADASVDVLCRPGSEITVWSIFGSGAIVMDGTGNITLDDARVHSEHTQSIAGSGTGNLEINDSHITSNYHTTISFGTTSAIITIKGSSVISSTSTSPTLRSDGSITVKDNSVVSSVNSNAIHISGSDAKVNISGGVVYAEGGAHTLLSSNASNTNTIVISNTGRVEARGSGNTIHGFYNVSVSGSAFVSSTMGRAIVSWRSVSVSDSAFVYNGSVNPAITVVNLAAIITISGGVVFSHGTGMYDVVSYPSAYPPVISDPAVVVAWDKAAGNTSYVASTTTDLDSAPSGATVSWDSSGGIAYANGVNTGIIPINGVTVTKRTLTESDLIYTDPTTLSHVYTGVAQGIGTVTLESPHDVDFNATTGGTVAVYYDGDTTAPTDVGTYTVEVRISGGTGYEAVAIPLGNYTIVKAAAPSITYPVATTITYGEALTSATLTGGSTVHGDFAWDDGSIYPTVVNSGYTVNFTPNAHTLANYEAISTLSETVAITVNKATTSGVPQTFEVVNTQAHTYSYDLSALLPNVSPRTLGTVTYNVTSVDNTDGVLATEPTNAVVSPLTLDVANAADIGKTAEITIAVSSDNYNDFTAVLTLETVPKQTVTITADVAGGIYNGMPYAYSNPVVTSDLDDSILSGITLDILYESTDGGTYSNPVAPTSAGDYKLTLSVPSDNLEYTGSESFDFTIAPKELTITDLVIADKAYDGNTTANISGTPSLDGIVGSDTVNLTNGTPTFVNRNVGDDIAINLTAFSLAGADAHNYTLIQPTGITANIHKANAPTGVAQIFNAVKDTAYTYSYDLAQLLPNVASLSLGTVRYRVGTASDVSGILASDPSSIIPVGIATPLSIDVASALVGQTAMVPVTFSSSNYDDFTVILTVEIIDKKPVNITAIVDNTTYGQTVTYDHVVFTSTTESDLVLNITPTVSYTGRNGTNYGPSTTAPTNAGDYTLTLSVPSIDMVYEGSANFDFTIVPKELTVTDLVVSNKTYDGDTTASISGTPSLVGIVGSDTVDLTNATPTFATKNVGDDIAIRFTAFSLSGADVSNYTLKQPTGITANIHKANLTWGSNGTVHDKTYDGTVNATVDTLPGLSGVIGSDDVTPLSGTVTFSSADVGSHTMIASGFSITGTDIGNYNAPIGNPTFTSGTIIQAAPTSFAIDIQDDGNGTASADTILATVGTHITLTATPNSSYAFKEWQVLSGGVTVTDNQFIMPAGAVTIKAIFEEIATPPTPSEYTIISGANQSWRKGTIAGVTITSDGDFADFIGIKVDGVLVDTTNYTAISGSTVVSLKASYLETLAIGRHTVELVFAEGTVQTGLTILNAAGITPTITPTTTPNNTGRTNTGSKLSSGVRTGDSSNLMLYVGLFTLASAVIVVLKKRKKQSFK